MTPDRPGYWWLGDEVAEVGVRGLDPGLECALCGDDVHMPVECYENWHGPVATPDEVEALRGALAQARAEVEALREAVRIAYQAGHEDTVEGQYADPAARAVDIIGEVAP